MPSGLRADGALDVRIYADAVVGRLCCKFGWVQGMPPADLWESRVSLGGGSRGPRSSRLPRRNWRDPDDGPPLMMGPVRPAIL